MRYELMNRYYGIKKIAPSEKAKDNILANCKKDPKDNQPVWQVTKELPDVVTPTREGELLTELEALRAELAQIKGEEVEAKQVAAEALSRPEPVKASKKKMGQKGSSIKG